MKTPTGLGLPYDKPETPAQLPELEKQLFVARIKGAIDYAVGELAALTGGHVVVAVECPSLQSGEQMASLIALSPGIHERRIDLCKMALAQAESNLRDAQAAARFTQGRDA